MMVRTTLQRGVGSMPKKRSTPVWKAMSLTIGEM